MGIKTVLAGVLGTGLVLSGIVFTGGANIDNIRQSVGNIQNKLEQAIADNEFLKGSYNTLKGTLDSTVQTANGTINELKRQKSVLEGQIEDLQKELADLKKAGSNGQVEMQAEIDRLESELKKANEQIATLDAEVKAVDESTTYTAVDKTKYTAPTSTTVDNGQGLFITPEAVAFNKAGATEMTKSVYTDKIEAEYKAQSMEFEIIGVDTFKTPDGQTFLSYVIKPKLSSIWDIYSDGVNQVLQAVGKGSVPYLYFENIDGKMVGRGQLQ